MWRELAIRQSCAAIKNNTRGKVEGGGFKDQLERISGDLSVDLEGLDRIGHQGDGRR